jgi:hypothetical protein
MSTNVINTVAYLRTTREFPEDLEQFTVEVNKAYVDIANVVNNRIISLFPTTKPAQNGESWFLVANQKQQGFRQVYTFIATTPIAHGVMVITPSQFIRCFGSYTDGTYTYGLIFGSTVAIGGQISFYITATEIVFVPDAGAPIPTAGTVVIEWVSQP